MSADTDTDAWDCRWQMVPHSWVSEQSNERIGPRTGSRVHAPAQESPLYCKSLKRHLYSNGNTTVICTSDFLQRSEGLLRSGDHERTVSCLMWCTRKQESSFWSSMLFQHDLRAASQPCDHFLASRASGANNSWLRLLIHSFIHSFVQHATCQSPS